MGTGVSDGRWRKPHIADRMALSSFLKALKVSLSCCILYWNFGNKNFSINEASAVVLQKSWTIWLTCPEGLPWIIYLAS